MIPGPTQIVDCPNCGHEAARPTYLTYNTLGATLWTDGVLDAPMAPRMTHLAICRKCHELFWPGEAPVRREVDAERSFAKDEISEPALPELYRAIAAGFAQSREQEIYLRTRALQLGNDRDRGGPWSRTLSGWSLGRKRRDAPYLHGSAAFIRNAEALIDLLNEDVDEERLQRAEAAREIGDYRQALDLLDRELPSDLLRTALVIRELAQRQHSRVSKASTDDATG